MVKQCYSCRYFSRYYIKGVKKYKQVKLGWCSDKVDTVNSTGVCDKYTSCPKFPQHKKILCYHLNDLLTEISEIRKILQEDKEIRPIEEM